MCLLCLRADASALPPTLPTRAHAASIESAFPGWARWVETHDSKCAQGDRARARTVRLAIGNTASAVPRAAKDGGSPREWYDWACFVGPVDPDVDGGAVAFVLFELHPTFANPRVAVRRPNADGAFEIRRRGWGTFVVGVEVADTAGGVHAFEHELWFAPGGAMTEVEIHVAAATPDDDGDSDGDDAADVGVRRSGERMAGVSERLMHGADGVGRGWAPPLVTMHCDEEARPGYDTARADEFHDDDATLRAKVRVLAGKIRSSSRFVAYTGAGISTASGIDDYASKTKRSAAAQARARANVRARSSPLDAEPTVSHFVLSALHRAGHMTSWVQQNHDGLPQKARYPQHALNEIHGAWFDPSNPVVPMSGHLRGDLCERLAGDVDSADLVLALGTSLCGMNADRVVEAAAERRLSGGVGGHGAVIVGFQRTRMDDRASLRVFAAIDEVMVLLARELGVPVAVEPYAPAPARSHVFTLPYGRDGRPLKPTGGGGSSGADGSGGGGGGGGGSATTLDLSVGARLKLIGGPGDGFEGRVVRTPDNRHPYSYAVEFPCTREGSSGFGKGRNTYALGAWMVEEACAGLLHRLPVVNT